MGNYYYRYALGPSNARRQPLEDPHLNNLLLPPDPKLLPSRKLKLDVGSIVIES